MSDEDLVSHDDLEAAAEAALEGDAEDEEQDRSAEGDADDGDAEDDDLEEEEVEDEPSDNAVRSKLGRRVSAFEERLEKLAALVEQGFTQLQAQQKVDAEEEEEEDDFDDDRPLTKRDIDRYLAKKEKEKTEEQTRYGNDYRAAVSDFMKTVDKGLHEDVITEFKKNYNKRYSDDGMADASANIRDAYIAVLQQKASVKPNPFDKKDEEREDDEDALGGPANSSRQPKKGKKKVKLDKAALDYAKKMGMSDEDIQDALSGETPSYLRG